FETVKEVIRTLSMTCRLSRQRLYRRERVLDPVIELINEDLLPALGPLAFGYVDEHVDGADEIPFGITKRRGIGDERNARAIGPLGYSLLAAHRPILL